MMGAKFPRFSKLVVVMPYFASVLLKTSCCVYFSMASEVVEIKLFPLCGA